MDTDAFSDVRGDDRVGADTSGVATSNVKTLDEDDELLAPGDAAHLLGIATNSLVALNRAGFLPAVRYGLTASAATRARRC